MEHNTYQSETDVKRIFEDKMVLKAYIMYHFLF